MKRPKKWVWGAEDAEDIPVRVLEELEAAEVKPGRPLIAVDADEVLVHFAEHFKAYAEARNYSFNLVEYRLDSALRNSAGGRLEAEEIKDLIWAFVREETHRQPEIDGAARALDRLARDAQIVVLTNAPVEVRAARIANLSAHGIDFPVVINEGGKGRALRWLAARAEAPVAFVDDSVAQHDSAARRAPHVARFHMVAPEILRPIIDRSPDAHAHVGGWEEAAPLIRRALDGD